MNRKLSLSGVALGILAAALAGCGDEQAGTTEQTQSAITARGFVTNGCTGQGVFDITSNDLINFVAVDQSSFRDVNARIYALDENNQEQLIATTQNASAIDSSLAQMLNEVSNYTSAAQRAEQLAVQRASSEQNAYARNLNTSDSVASTSTTSTHAADSYSKQFTRVNTSGWNNQESSRDVHSRADAMNSASTQQSANALQRNEILARTSEFANAGQFANALNGSRNAINSVRNAGSASDSSNDVSSSANNGAITNANQISGQSVIGAAPVGWGWGGMGWGDMSTQSAFNRSAVFNHQFANASNDANAAQNTSAYANAIDRQFSNVFNDANQSSYANAGSRALDVARQSSAANTNRASQVASASNLHDDQATHTAYDTNDYREVIAGASERLSNADSARTVNHRANANTSLSARAANSASRNQVLSAAEQQARAQSRNQSESSQLDKQFQAMTNLSRYNARNLVMHLNVTANNENAVLRIFTGNNQNNVAANREFAQSFAGCGLGGGAIVPAKVVPLNPASAEAASIGELGDHVAKPE